MATVVSAMTENLEIAWNKLSLTEEEATVAVFDKDTPVEKAEEVALSLVGKLMCDSSFNARVMKSVLKSIWKPAKGIVIRDNLFVF